jgi:hypothetical protein
MGENGVDLPVGMHAVRGHETCARRVIVYIGDAQTANVKLFDIARLVFPPHLGREQGHGGEKATQNGDACATLQEARSGFCDLKSRSKRADSGQECMRQLKKRPRPACRPRSDRHSSFVHERRMADTSAFGTPECALSIEAQLFRWQRQGGNDACADCGSVVAIDWCSISAAAPAPSQTSTGAPASVPAASADAQALSSSAAAATVPVSTLNVTSASALADPDLDPHRWAVTLCPACAGVHRAMGRQLCVVLSLTMDSWTLALVRRCVTFGPRFESCLVLCSLTMPFSLKNAKFSE